MKELQVAEIVRVLVLSWKHEYFKHELKSFFQCGTKITPCTAQTPPHFFFTKEHIVLFFRVVACLKRCTFIILYCEK